MLLGQSCERENSQSTDSTNQLAAEQIETWCAVAYPAAEKKHGLVDLVTVELH
jgi:hypothetical protein